MPNGDSLFPPVTDLPQPSPQPPPSRFRENPMVRQPHSRTNQQSPNIPWRGKSTNVHSQTRSFQPTRQYTRALPFLSQTSLTPPSQKQYAAFWPSLRPDFIATAMSLLVNSSGSSASIMANRSAIEAMV